MEPRDVAVVGAGRVGQVLAGRLGRAGHRITLVARPGQVHGLADDGVRLSPGGQGAAVTHVPVVSALPAGGTFTDVVLAVRTDQLDDAIEAVRTAGVRARSLVLCPPFWGPQPGYRVAGIGETWAMFPGFLAGPGPDGAIRYLVSRRPTRLGPLTGEPGDDVRAFAAALDAAGITTRVRSDMGWCYTSLLGAANAWALAVQAAGFDLAALARDRELRRLATRATRESIELTTARFGRGVGAAGVLAHASGVIAVTGRLAAPTTRRGWGAVNWEHRRSVAGQDQAATAELCRWAADHGRPARALGELLAAATAWTTEDDARRSGC